MPPDYSSGSIGQLAWDNTPNTLLFYYHYNRGSSRSPDLIDLLYRLPLDRTPDKPLETIPKQKTEELLPLFSHLGEAYIREHLQEWKPFDQQTIPIPLRYDMYTSYDPNTKLMLVAYPNEKAVDAPSTIIYSVVNLDNKVFRNLDFSIVYSGVNSDEHVLIRWTGFSSDILIEYTINRVVYHAKATIDALNMKVTNLKIFKSYDISKGENNSNRITAIGPFDLSHGTIHNNDYDVKILGWETPDIVYYVEKKPNSKTVDLLKYDFMSQSENKVASMNINNTYYSQLSYHGQISIPQKKVAFIVQGDRPGIQDLIVSNLDGTERKLLISRIKDLPLGNPIPIQ